MPARTRYRSKPRKENAEGFGCFYIIICVISICLCAILSNLFHVGSFVRHRLLLSLAFAFVVIAAHYTVHRIRNGPHPWTWNSFRPWWLLLLSPLMIALAVFVATHNGVVRIEGGVVITNLPPPVTYLMGLVGAALLIAGMVGLGKVMVLILFSIDRLVSSIFRSVGRTAK
ncbi:MAG: hypothetical protein ABSF23_07035 [Terracidiphilus sp.]|jgi:hypothetical protein